METQLENRLEEMLRLAADEPAHRLEFYRVLLSSEIYVFGTAGVGHEGAVILDAGNKISLQHWEKHDGTPVVPFFSSLDSLQCAIDQEQSYLRLPARSLFEITLGTTLFLNPKAPHGQEFVPQEVRQL